MSKRILFVDDETQILRALKRLFVHSTYEAFFADNAKLALELLEKYEMDLIVTDIRMPNIDGFELLREVKRKYPLTLRVALSGYTDNKKIYNALEDNLAKLYLFKPWDNNELMAIIDRLFNLEEDLKDKDLLNLINNINKLPTVPDLYNQITNLIEKDANIDEISRKLEEDQSISSRILRVANSAFYGAKTGSIAQSIMYIGLTNVKNIVLSNGIFSDFKGDAKLKNQLWSHANYSNKIMNLIYQKCLFKKTPNMYASAGLLHDIGKVVILQHFQEKYEEIQTKALSEGKTIQDVENSILGIDHQKIGGYLLNWWEIPTPIVEAAMYHHIPLSDNIINKELVQVVHIANHYAWYLVNGEVSTNSLNMDVFEELKISHEKVKKVIDELENE